MRRGFRGRARVAAGPAVLGPLDAALTPVPGPPLPGDGQIAAAVLIGRMVPVSAGAIVRGGVLPVDRWAHGRIARQPQGPARAGPAGRLVVEALTGWSTGGRSSLERDGPHTALKDGRRGAFAGAAPGGTLAGMAVPASGRLTADAAEAADQPISRDRQHNEQN
ncbi:hypothetical protein I3F58_26265 [Streptomyces sp. MUM 203J]|uniref:hypothetical protein n=1 Tax=Streptomyces sp. MUM 203J TaxID=2791990 RepID=UPI001F04BA10|nr:hypothetical protein [Streptomyces sp. MUM 203J]MCH0542997.1 hypothetical protein [Streptomyces sp. MUM 203J]